MTADPSPPSPTSSGFPAVAASAPMSTVGFPPPPPKVSFPTATSAWTDLPSPRLPPISHTAYRDNTPRSPLHLPSLTSPSFPYSMRSSESPRSPNRLLAEHGYAYGGRSGEPLGLMSPGLALSPLSLGNNSSSGGGLSSLTRVISLPESNERGDYTGMNMSDVDNTSSHRERPGATSDDDERPHPRIFSPRPFAPIRPWDEPRDRMQVDDEDGAHSNTVRRSFGHTRSALGLVAEPGTDDDERMPERMPSQTLSGSVSPVHRLHGLHLPPAHRSYSHGAADSSGPHRRGRISSLAQLHDPIVPLPTHIPASKNSHGPTYGPYEAAMGVRPQRWSDPFARHEPSRVQTRMDTDEVGLQSPRTVHRPLPVVGRDMTFADYHSALLPSPNTFMRTRRRSSLRDVTEALHEPHQHGRYAHREVSPMDIDGAPHRSLSRQGVQAASLLASRLDRGAVSGDDRNHEHVADSYPRLDRKISRDVEAVELSPYPSTPELSRRGSEEQPCMVDAGDPDAAADHPDELIALGLLDQALRSDGKPRRPMNAFMIYARHRRKEIATSGLDLKTGEISGILSKEWAGMSATQKQPWQSLAQRLKDDFQHRYPGYEYTRSANGTRKRGSRGGKMPTKKRGRDVSEEDDDDTLPLSPRTPLQSNRRGSMGGLQFDRPPFSPSSHDAPTAETVEEIRLRTLYHVGKSRKVSTSTSSSRLRAAAPGYELNLPEPSMPRHWPTPYSPRSRPSLPAPPVRLLGKRSDSSVPTTTLQTPTAPRRNYMREYDGDDEEMRPTPSKTSGKANGGDWATSPEAASPEWAEGRRRASYFS